jgi:hypothetical protein
MLISTALLLDSIIRNSVCTPAKLPCRRVEVGYEKMSKHFESTFKTINLCLRRSHSFEQFKQNQTKFSFLQNVEKGKNF